MDVLISGAGIAGLTLAILLKEKGYRPLVIEREPQLRREGYMMDFFGTGWDVAERMGLVDELRAIRYPIARMEFVDAAGRVYYRFPIERVRAALDDKYVYLRRPDLEQILFRHAQNAGVDIRFGTSVRALRERVTDVEATFEDGSSALFSLVFGADGVHSRVRDICFGPEDRFERFLGGYVAAFHLDGHDYGIGHALKWYEEADRAAAFYPLAGNRIDTTLIFHSEPLGHVSHDKRLAMLKKRYAGAGFITPRVLADAVPGEPVYFDSLTQIVMPHWSRGRVALLGDACGCLTLLAGQGSHMAMAGAFVIARELERHRGDHVAAFAAYEKRLQAPVARKQHDAVAFARFFVPSQNSRPWLRRLAIRAIFSRWSMRLLWRRFGTVSVLKGYA